MSVMPATTNTLFSILRSAVTSARPTFAGANLRASNKPVRDSRFVNGMSAGPLMYWAHSDWVDAFSVGLHPHKVTPHWRA